MTLVDRRYGVSSGLAVKAPCRAATTANIALSGEQTIDGVALAANDRVLVKNQSTGSQNGIYVVSTGNWTRALDFDGARDVVRGTMVFVHSGTINQNTNFAVTSADPITIGSSNITFSSIVTLLNQAPGNADYLVRTANGTLTAERVVTDVATARGVVWDFATAGQAKATVVAASETLAGAVELANADETRAGLSQTLAVHPAGLATALSLQAPIAAGFKNLVIRNTVGNEDTRVDVDADAVTVETNAGAAYRLRNINLTINCAATGANGLDQGSLAANTWYAVLVIYNPTTQTTAGLMVTEANLVSAVMPSGYSATARLGWFRTNASAQFHRILQKGLRAQYVVSATVTTVYPEVGNTTGVGYAAKDVTAFVPPTAGVIHLVGTTNSACTASIAPGNAAAVGNVNAPAAIFSVNGSSADSEQGSFMLEGSNIYLSTNAGTLRAFVIGWDDNI